MANADVRLISLAECVVGALAHRSGTALILSTDGTRVARVFTRRLDEQGVRYVEPSEAIQEELMRAIYEGVKALDWKIAAAAGEAVLTEILAANPDVDCIVAGCTEIPQILALLQRSASDALKKRLAGVEVLDPVELAFQAVAGNGRAA
jgi:aspartate/glutamate racemase